MLVLNCAELQALRLRIGSVDKNQRKAPAQEIDDA
jgi:hypothetical protein